MVKDYNKESIENLEKELIDISQEVKSPFSNKKELKEKYLKVFNKWENEKHKRLKSSKNKKKSVKKWGKMEENGEKDVSE
jgi:hypothetical protein